MLTATYPSMADFMTAADHTDRLIAQFIYYRQRVGTPAFYGWRQFHRSLMRSLMRTGPIRVGGAVYYAQARRIWRRDVNPLKPEPDARFVPVPGGTAIASPWSHPGVN